MAFIMDAVTVCTTRANMLYVLSFFLLINRTKLTIIFERPILEQAVNVRVHASFDSCYDHRGSRFMIIKRHRLSLSLSFFSLVFSLAADSFLKTNFDFPIRGRDLRPPVSPGRLFCALSRPLSSLHARDFFFSGLAKEVRALFYCPFICPTRKTAWQSPSPARNGFTYERTRTTLTHSPIHAFACSPRNRNRLVMHAWSSKSGQGKIDSPGLRKLRLERPDFPTLTTLDLQVETHSQNKSHPVKSSDRCNYKRLQDEGWNYDWEWRNEHLSSG